MPVVVKKTRRLGGGGGGGQGDRGGSPLRPEFVPRIPPCTKACPNHHDIRAILTTIAQAESRGKPYDQAFAEAFYILADLNPLPASCGRICPHQCEKQCNRAHLDEPAAINCLERFLGDYALEKALPLKRLTAERQPEPIAVVGSGPGGLSCAYQLARRGYPVTVFEAFPHPGGMLRYGTPAFRLPRRILEAEIDRLRPLGIDFHCGQALGRELSLEELRQSHAAVFIGIRAKRGPRLGLPGEEAPNVLSGIEFLHRVNAGEIPDLGETVVVVGGGDTGVDAARVAVRLGKQTTLLSRRAVPDMAADPHAVREAEREGVRIEPLAAPSAVVAEAGRATGLTCRRLQQNETDAAVRPAAELFLPADTIIVALKQERDTAGLETLCDGSGKLSLGQDGETAAPNSFAEADDLELGIVSTAIFRGRHAAELIDARLRGGRAESPVAAPVISHDRMRLEYYPKQPRVELPTRSVADREAEPDGEVDLTLQAEQAVAEAKRCLSCGLCFACDTCWKYCQEQAIQKPAEKGMPYRIRLEFCTGCKKCAEECPCGCIEMR